MRNDRNYRGIHCESYGWKAPGYVPADCAEPVTAIDRNGSYPSAVSSVVVPHDALEHTQRIDLGNLDTPKPGFYLMRCYPWHETHVPNPFPWPGEPGQEYWVPAPVARLLADLAKDGRWPDSVAEDSWTCERGSRLSNWAHYINELRDYALTYYGDPSEQYSNVKDGYGRAFTLMRGRVEDNKVVHPDCKNNRRDWHEMIISQSAVTIWRTADKIGCALAIKLTDTIVIPSRELDRIVNDGHIQLNNRLGGYHIKEQ
jgi:hypothetical protein